MNYLQIEVLPLQGTEFKYLSVNIAQENTVTQIQKQKCHNAIVYMKHCYLSCDKYHLPVVFSIKYWQTNTTESESILLKITPAV